MEGRNWIILHNIQWLIVYPLADWQYYKCLALYGDFIRTFQAHQIGRNRMACANHIAPRWLTAACRGDGKRFCHGLPLRNVAYITTNICSPVFPATGSNGHVPHHLKLLISQPQHCLLPSDPAGNFCRNGVPGALNVVCSDIRANLIGY